MNRNVDVAKYQRRILLEAEVLKQNLLNTTDGPWVSSLQVT